MYKRQQTGFLRVLSTGGGAITLVGRPDAALPEVYAETSYAEIAAWCKSNHARLPDYVERNEGKHIWDDLYRVWEAMKRSIVHGLSVSGELPGGLHVERKAQFLYEQRHIDESQATRENRLVCAYAFAVAEENAGGGVIVKMCIRDRSRCRCAYRRRNCNRER